MRQYWRKEQIRFLRNCRYATVLLVLLVLSVSLDEKHTPNVCVCLYCVISVYRGWLLLNFTDRESRLKETHNHFILSRSEQKHAVAMIFTSARISPQQALPPVNNWQLNSGLMIFHTCSCLYACAVISCSARLKRNQTLAKHTRLHWGLCKTNVCIHSEMWFYFFKSRIITSL